MNSSENNPEIVALALSDSLFEPDSISLEPLGKSLTVRQKPEAKHFNVRHLVEIPCWNEDEELDACPKCAKVIL